MDNALHDSLTVVLLFMHSVKMENGFVNTQKVKVIIFVCLKIQYSKKNCKSVLEDLFFLAVHRFKRQT